MASNKRIRGVFEKVKGSNIWWIRYTDKDGKLHREKAGTITMAKNLLAKRRLAVLQQDKLPELNRRAIMFSELIDDALAYSKTHKRSYRDDVCRMGRIREWFGNLPVESVTIGEIESRLDKLAQDEKLAPATLNRYRSLLSMIFRRAIIAGKANLNPARLVTHRHEDNKRVRYLTQDEETRLRAVIRKYWPEREPELDISLNTGLRRGGMYGLEWRDIDFEHAILTERLSKSGKTRYLPLNRVALEAFLTLRRRSSGQGRIFDTRKPRHWFDKAVALAGIEDYHWHDNRHTYASRLTMAGTPLRVVQSLMGHGSIVTTTRYAHLEPGIERAAVEKLESFAPMKNGSDTTTDTGGFRIQ